MVDKLEAAARAICKARNMDPDTCVEGSGGASADGVAFTVCHKRRWQWYLADASAALASATPANGEQVERIVEELCAGRDGSQPGPMSAYRQGVRDMAARLATLSTPTEDARERVKVLREALEAIRDGDVPRPVHCHWRADGKPSKLDECKHGVTMSEDCAGCTAEFIDTALGNKETDHAGA